MSLFALVINYVPDFYSGDVWATLRRDAISLILGSVLTVIGSLAAAAFTAWKGTADRSLLWFGVFTSLYGARLLFSASVFRFTAEPIPQQVWIYLAAAITYFILPLGVLFFSLQNGLMRYAAAGHPALLCYQEAQGTTDSITENGLTRLFPSASYSVVEHKLCQGTRFLLYTDGRLEASNRREQFFGEERVREALRNAQSLSAEQCAALPVEYIQQWTADRQEDDLTMIVIDVHGLPVSEHEIEPAVKSR